MSEHDPRYCTTCLEMLTSELDFTDEIVQDWIVE